MLGYLSINVNEQTAMFLRRMQEQGIYPTEVVQRAIAMYAASLDKETEDS